MDAILTGEPIAAARAYQLGLVSRLVEPDVVFDTAMDVARAIASAAPLAVRASRAIVQSASFADDETLRARSRAALDELLQSDDTAEGLRAFAEKRPPEWQGQ
jgi:enoyl-CoA hydratase